MRHFGRLEKINEKLLAYLTPDEARGAPGWLTQYQTRLPTRATDLLHTAAPLTLRQHEPGMSTGAMEPLRSAASQLKASLQCRLRAYSDSRIEEGKANHTISN
ncbi:hypothetical protein E2C01_052157 [Portunus trituberculatus]|uniref:Uncharacterized protein n=1 Tax=Portunus trituberculatus TaxID=210409 RepID=A0A5B7GGT7_PORTR|nr:hypothetical protein [Portunus trituberculatus]